MLRGVPISVLVIVFLIGASLLPVASAHFKDAKIEIYKAVTIPVIDGTYNMTLEKVQIGGQEKLVDEWNDAAWIEIPKRSQVSTSGITAYSGYKYDDQFLYVAIDVPSATVMITQGSAGTVFDPMHDGGSQEAKPDDFIVLPYWKDSQTFQIWIRYGSAEGVYGPFQTVPEGLVAKSAMSPTPVLSKAHLFYELRIPLTVGNLSRYIGSTIGFSQEVFIRDVGDNMYPTDGGGFAFIPDNYADATFSRNANPNPTTPAIPEFPAPLVPAALFIVLLTAQMTTKRRRWQVSKSFT